MTELRQPPLARTPVGTPSSRPPRVRPKVSMRRGQPTLWRAGRRGGSCELFLSRGTTCVARVTRHRQTGTSLQGECAGWRMSAPRPGTWCLYKGIRTTGDVVLQPSCTPCTPFMGRRPRSGGVKTSDWASWGRSLMDAGRKRRLSVLAELYVKRGCGGRIDGSADP